MARQTGITVGGVTLEVKIWVSSEGRGTPVVLLPGTAATAEDWDPVAGLLVRSRPVYAVSLRGHGGSDWPGDYSIQLMADDVVGLLPELGDQPVDLVGHSMGGLVGCLVVASNPDLVRRLVLEDVGLLQPRRPAMPSRPDGPLPFDWRVVEQVRPEIDDPDPRWPQVVGEISVPTLVVAGGPSSTVPQEHVAELARTVRDGQLVTIDTGHLVHATHPDGFVRAVQTFLDSEHRIGDPLH